VDWEDIPKATDWLKTIYEGIDTADTFIFITSSHSLTSEICNYELQYALNNNKRIIPVIREKIEDDVETTVKGTWFGKDWQNIADENWKQLGHLNWLFFDDDDTFEAEFDNLIETIDTDLDYLKEHTYFHNRAQEWEEHTNSPSFLAYGDELIRAEAWLANAEGKSPPPTEQQRTFITTSRQIEDEQEARQKRLQTLVRSASVAVVILIMVAIGAGILTVDSINNSNIASTDVAQAEIEINNAQFANTQSAELRQEAQDFADSVSLANRGQQLANNERPSLGLRLAYEASLIDTNPQVQGILTNIAFNPQWGIRQEFNGHDGWFVLSVAFSPDGKTIVSGAADSTIKLWNVETDDELQTFSGHGGRVTSVAFSPDGQTIASGSWDHTIKLWDVATGDELLTFNESRGFVDSVVFSPDGQTIASGAIDKTIKLWDVATGEEIRTFTGHTDGVWSVAFSPDGQTIASGSRDETIKLWNVTTGEELLTLFGHTEFVTSVRFSPDGQTLASGSWDRNIKLWDVTTGEELYTFSEHISAINSVAFSPDGQIIVLGAMNSNTIKLLRVYSLDQLQAWVRENRYMSELMCAERLMYGLSPCVNNVPPATPTFVPTRTPFPVGDA